MLVGEIDRERHGGALLVIRHGEDSLAAAGILGGWLDCELSDQGERQVRQAGTTWRATNGETYAIDAIASSDLKRARQSAQIIGQQLGIDHVDVSALWRPRHLGTWQGLSIDQLSSEPDFLTWQLEPERTPPGGEPWHEFASRIERAVAETPRRGGATLVVSHDSVQQFLLERHMLPPGQLDPLLEAVAIEQPGNASTIYRPLGVRDCLTCTLARSERRHGGPLVWRDELVQVNAYLEHDTARSHNGWFVASPRRHVERWFDLTISERHRLSDVAAAVDLFLTDRYGATRTMVASLGWFVGDHLHVHLVPTFDRHVTRGWENFAGAYVSVHDDPIEMHDALGAHLEDHFGPVF